MVPDQMASDLDLLCFFFFKKNLRSEVQWLYYDFIPNYENAMPYLWSKHFTFCLLVTIFDIIGHLLIHVTYANSLVPLNVMSDLGPKHLMLLFMAFQTEFFMIVKTSSDEKARQLTSVQRVTIPKMNK